MWPAAATSLHGADLSDSEKSDKRSLHAAKCKYSQTQSSELVQLHRLRAMLLRFGTRKQKQLSQVTAARTETTLQVSQSRSNGTCALATVLGKYCEGSKYSYRKQGTSLTVFHTGSLTGEFSVTSEEEKAQKFKQHLLVQAIFLCVVFVSRPRFRRSSFVVILSQWEQRRHGSIYHSCKFFSPDECVMLSTMRWPMFMLDCPMTEDRHHVS